MLDHKLEVDKIKQNKSEVEYLNSDLVAHEKLVERGKAVDRLLRNRDFKKLILEDFMGTNASNSAMLSVDLKMNPEARAAALAMAQAPGYLLQFLTATTQQAHISEGRVAEIKDALIEVRNENFDEE